MVLSGDITVLLNNKGLMFIFSGGFIGLPSDLGVNSYIHIFLARS